jgi:NAD(P)H-flavin reductase/hemoglobin-like flavoprotein
VGTLGLLLKESWANVEEHADDLANRFYARIFLSHPSLRDLFPVEMTRQRSRLLDALVSAVQMVDDPERFDEFLRGLGRDHRKFHVSPDHYGTVGEALLDAVRAYSGEHWSVEHEQAWRDAYDAMATKMITGAEESTGSPPFWHSVVVSHERRGRDVAVFTCKPLLPFTFRPGQYVTLECQYQPRLWRPYSIANAPRANGTVDFHVRAPTDGWVSAALVRQLQVGDVVRLGAPMGSMTLDPDSTRDIVCVAGDTGLAPLKALIEELALNNYTRWAHVFVGADDRDDLYDLPEITRMARRYPWLSVVATCADDPGYVGERGQVNEVVERYGPWAGHDFFVSGSPAMVRATLGSLARMGVPDERIRYDALVNLSSARAAPGPGTPRPGPA